MRLLSEVMIRVIAGVAATSHQSINHQYRPTREAERFVVRDTGVLEGTLRSSSFMCVCMCV